MFSGNDLIEQMESLIRRDPAARGLLADSTGGDGLARGALLGAARSLSERPGHVVLITGFFIPSAEPANAETDGPPGTALLAAVLEKLGHTVEIVTDELCEPVVTAAARGYQLSESIVQAAPVEPLQFESWYSDYCRRLALSRPAHFIAIERVGASHDMQSVQQQVRNGDPPLAEFADKVPAAMHSRRFTMRGECLAAWSAPLERILEDHKRISPESRTIGIGDGGNEIGMGTFPWETLVARLPTVSPPWIVCRTPADHTIVSGVSNWAAMAVAAATARLCDRVDALADWHCEHHESVLRQMVEAGAVDGISRKPATSVDGLPFPAYVQTWRAIRELLALPR
ncbi:MAG: DUF4392 domain-containing protein [Planctomycetaceae bacterium]|nr:DUF4392 domain-containing protein [Planctomycetaceae bacterium]